MQNHGHRIIHMKAFVSLFSTSVTLTNSLSDTLRTVDLGITAWFHNAAKFGRIDFLVNNGGGQFPCPVADMSLKVTIQYRNYHNEPKGIQNS